MKGTIGVGVLVRASTGEILVGHRIKPGETASWCLPGGHVEPSESLEEAALRELREETGLDVGASEVQVFNVLADLASARPHIVGCTVVELRGRPIVDPVEGEVFDEWRWVSPDELPSPLFPASAALIKAAKGEPADTNWAEYRVRGSFL